MEVDPCSYIQGSTQGMEVIWAASGLFFAPSPNSHWIAMLGGFIEPENKGGVQSWAQLLRQPPPLRSLITAAHVTRTSCCLHEQLNSNPQDEFFKHRFGWGSWLSVPRFCKTPCPAYLFWALKDLWESDSMCGPHTCVVSKTCSWAGCSVWITLCYYENRVKQKMIFNRSLF